MMEEQKSIVTSKPPFMPVARIRALLDGRRVCFGANRYTVQFVLGLAAVVVSFVIRGTDGFIGVLAAITSFVLRWGGICGAAVGFLGMVRIPWELVDYAPLITIVKNMLEIIERANEQQSMLSQLRVCREQDVPQVVNKLWGGMTENQRTKHAYLSDGQNDKQDWTNLITHRYYNDMENLFSLACKVAEWADHTRAQMGTGYEQGEYVIAEPATKKRTVHKGRGQQITDEELVITEKVAALGIEITPDGSPEVGPAITRYSFRIPDGVKVSKVAGMADDIALALALGDKKVMISAIPGRSNVIGIEVPRAKPEKVSFAQMITCAEFTQHKSPVAFVLGKDISGKPVVADIRELPHVLISGTTGSGKSVCENALICSILSRATPQEVQFIMIDPKWVELAPYSGIPHLARPIVTDPEEAVSVLEETAKEMIARYKVMMAAGAKKIEEYNKNAAEPFPYLVVVVDEMAQLIDCAKDKVAESIKSIAQMGRAAGVHLVLATQRPTADVVDGRVKANVPSRIALSVASAMDSRIALDEAGAETLIGHGDLYYKKNGESKVRVQGAFISNEEIAVVIEKAKQGG